MLVFEFFRSIGSNVDPITDAMIYTVAIKESEMMEGQICGRDVVGYQSYLVVKSLGERIVLVSRRTVIMSDRPIEPGLRRWLPNEMPFPSVECMTTYQMDILRGREDWTLKNTFVWLPDDF